MRRTLLATLVTATLVVSVLAVRELVRSGPAQPMLNRAERSARDFPSGVHAIVIVFVASDCSFCRQERTKSVLTRLIAAVRPQVGTEVVRVTVVGVATDPDLGDGYAYLMDLQDRGARFDQISVGGSWLNEFVTRNLWRDGAGKPATPAILVLARRINAATFPDSIGVGTDSVVRFASGTEQIAAWLDGGAALLR